MACDSNLYEPRVRIKNDIKSELTWSMRRMESASIPYPSPSCKTAPVQTLSQPHGDKVLGYSSYYSEINDVVMTSDAKQRIKDGDLTVPNRCFKPVNHFTDRSAILGDTNDYITTECGTWQVYIYAVGNGSRSAWYDFKPIPPYASEAPWYYDPKAYYEAAGGHILPFHVVTDTELSHASQRLSTPDNQLDDVMLYNLVAESREIGRLKDLFIRKYGTILKYVSNNFLGINFGVLPLVNDLEKLAVMTQNLSAKIEQWNDLAKKQSVVTFKATVFTHELRDTHDFIGNVFGGQATGEIDVVGTSTCKLHVYAIPKKCTFDVTSLKRSKYGLNNPLSAVWEAIPYSFVIDWMFDIQKYIEQFEQEEDYFKYDVVEAGYSLMNEHVYTTTGDINYDSLSPSSITQEVTLLPYERRIKSYERVKVSASLLHQFQTEKLSYTPHFLSPFQTLLGASLLTH